MNERFDQIRREIAENDESIVAGVNRRLALVTELWALKAELGLDTVDPDRERRLREALAAANAGPLSPAGLDRLVTELLDLTKAELGASPESSGDDPPR
jgi:chorismate mutase